MSALVYSPDGRRLYSASSDGLVRRWTPIPDPDPAQTIGDAGLVPWVVGVSRDGRSFFTWSISTFGDRRSEIIHRDLASNRELARFETTGLDWLSGDGSRVAFQKPDERRIRVWDVIAHRELASFESERWPTGLKSFSPDGRIFAASEPGQITLWDSENGKHLRSFSTNRASAFAFSPDGRFFAISATRAGESALFVTIWNTSTLTEYGKLPGPATDYLTFSQDSRTLAVIYADKVTLWDVNSQAVQTSLKLSQPNTGFKSWHYRDSCFSPDGKLFALFENTHVGLWNTATGERVGFMAGSWGRTLDLAWSPDGKTLTTASGPKVKLWNVATREELTTLQSTNAVACHAFAPDGSLVVADQMNRVRLWRTGLDRNAR
jgi:WD40 repeat protein